MKKWSKKIKQQLVKLPAEIFENLINKWYSSVLSLELYYFHTSCTKRNKLWIFSIQGIFNYNILILKVALAQSL